VAEFARPGVGCETTEQCNRYCFHVGSNLSFGLLQLFADSGFLEKELRTNERFGRSTGVFFTKTMLIMDYFEDVAEGRSWWPKDVWSLYATSLKQFRDRPEHTRSLACLNHLITDTMECAPDCIDCLRRMGPRVFEFVAVMQVMSMAALCEMYNNPAVFRKGYQLRKGRVARIMTDTTNMMQANRWFLDLCLELKNKVDPCDPNFAKTHAVLDRTLEKLEPVQTSNRSCSSTLLLIMSLLALLAFFFKYLRN